MTEAPAKGGASKTEAATENPSKGGASKTETAAQAPAKGEASKTEAAVQAPAKGEAEAPGKTDPSQLSADLPAGDTTEQNGKTSGNPKTGTSETAVLPGENAPGLTKETPAQGSSETQMPDSIPKDSAQPDRTNGQNGGNAASSGQFPSGGTDRSSMPGAGTFSGGFSGNGSITAPGESAGEEEPVYAVTEVNVCSIASRKQARIQVSIDELDIVHIRSGQSCEVTFDAIAGRSFEGTVEELDRTGENEGGNTKYSVTVVLDRDERMLTGMNAHIVFENETKSGIRVIPESALAEKNGKVYVYTEYDEEKDELGGLREVETGLADGEKVEVVSGLEEGDRIYYRYADSLTYRFLNSK